MLRLILFENIYNLSYPETRNEKRHQLQGAQGKDEQVFFCVAAEWKSVVKLMADIKQIEHDSYQPCQCSL